MGMSASQARLLSITSRLTNNEFRSQTITNSKLRLAEKSEEASAEYMDALNSQQLVFGVYGDDGGYSTEKLTPALIYDYAPLKNQYALVNPAGKLLVSAVDAKNFEATIDKPNPLAEFLKCYGLIKDIGYMQKVEKPNPAWTDWYNKQQENKTDLYALFSGIVGTSDIAQTDGSGAKYCYNSALNGGATCYLHLLNYLLDYNGTSPEGHNYSTTNGKALTTNGNTGGMTSHLTPENHQTFKEISELLDKRYCDGDDDFKTEGEQNILQAARTAGRVPNELEILRSDFKEVVNDDGTYSYEKKTLKQKAIDMYYIIQNSSAFSIDRSIMNEMLMNFTDGDMKKIDQEPEPPTTIIEFEQQNETTVNDKDKAQWYTNLWYMMNGSDTVNKIKQEEIFDDEKNESYSVFIVDSAQKSGKGGTYEVFEDLNLFKSSDWLQFALEHGMVTMVQAQYDNPAADSGKVPQLTSEGITWKSIIYTNASDIRSQEDEVKIAIAEVKYKNAIRDIENKDKKFDQDLKKLDTEHTALQTEYDSIKEVISKNVERSFKAFS